MTYLKEPKNWGAVSGKLLIAAVCLIGLLLGIEDGGLQFVLLKVGKSFHLSQTEMGTVVSVQFIAVTISPLLVGVLSDRIGKKKIAMWCTLLFAASGFLCFYAGSITVFLAGICGIGVSFGALETVTAAALADAYGKQSAKYLTIMQGMFSLGAVLSPFLLDYGMNWLGFDWRSLFFICAFTSLGSFCLVGMTAFKENVAESLTEKAGHSTVEKAGRPLKELVRIYLVGLVICVCIYVAMENGAAYFLDSFTSETLHAKESSAVALSAFWASMAISRFLASKLYKISNIMIPGCFLASGVLLVILSRVTEPGGVIAICFCLGLFYGPIWPFLMSLATSRFPQNTGLATSIMLAAGGVGGTLSPIFVGMIGDGLGLRTAFIALAAISAAGAFVFVRQNHKYLKE